MKKLNPLFVDSTKMRGDMITAQIELVDLSNYFGSSVYVKLHQDELGEEQVYHLSKAGESTWKVQVRLSHQQEVTFQFFVARDGLVLAHSKSKTVPATYVISDRWKADMSDQASAILPIREVAALAEENAIESNASDEIKEVVEVLLTETSVDNTSVPIEEKPLEHESTDLSLEEVESEPLQEMIDPVAITEVKDSPESTGVAEELSAQEVTEAVDQMSEVDVELSHEPSVDVEAKPLEDAPGVEARFEEVLPEGAFATTSEIADETNEFEIKSGSEAQPQHIEI